MVGNEVQNSKMKIFLRCHANHSWIFLANGPHDDSQYNWSQTCNHGIGTGSFDNLSSSLA